MGGFIIRADEKPVGKWASAWQFLRSYRITHAQPQQFPARLNRRSAQ